MCRGWSAFERPASVLNLKLLGWSTTLCFLATVQIKRMHQDGTKEPQPAAPTTGDAATDRRSAAKRAAVGMGMLVSLTRHSSQLAVAVADQGGLQAAVSCLADTDPEVKEGAGGCLGHGWCVGWLVVALPDARGGWAPAFPVISVKAVPLQLSLPLRIGHQQQCT